MVKRHRFPAGLRPSTLEERKLFYEEEFNEKKAREWIRSFVKVDTGRDSGIVKPGLKPELIMLKPWRNLRERLLYYLPEDVYYDRNSYSSLNLCLHCNIFFGKIGDKYCWWVCRNAISQELAFDVDPENINLSKSRPSIYSFTEEEFNEARLITIELIEWLGQYFRHIFPIFSGRGFHVVVKDEHAVRLSMKEREALIEALPERIRKAIDPWVTRGNIRLLRLPYSLHGLVSRICMPLSKRDLEKEDLLHRFKPKFLD